MVIASMNIRNTIFLKKEVQDFLLVSQFNNFSKAAEFQGVQQSGLSKSIKKLEREFEAPLFIRKSKGLELTQLGNLFKEFIKNSDQLFSHFAEDLSKLEHKVTGHFKLGSYHVLAKYFLPRLIKSMEPFPELKIDFDFSTSKECTEKVLQNELDLAVVAGPNPYPDLVIKKLWREYIGLYSFDGKLKTKALYHGKMLDIQKFLCKYPKHRQQRIDNYDIIYSILKRNEAMGFLPHPLALREGKLKEIEIFKPGVDICLIYRSDTYKSLGLKTIIQSIQKLDLKSRFHYS